MPVRAPRFAAPLALIALVLGACSDTTGPRAAEPSTAVEPAEAATQVYAYSATLQGIIQVPLGDVVAECLAEPVEVHFKGRFRVMLVQMANGERSFSSVHLNDMGSWAIGGEAGTVYRLAGASLDQSSDGANG
jgi:hypothetical protein